MPAYEIEHVVPLSSQQKDEIAQSITATHTSLFTTPSLFVNVRFTDASKQDVYVGGKKVALSTPRQRVAKEAYLVQKRTNRILAHVRAGGGRSNTQFNELCSTLELMWATHAQQSESGGPDDWDLRIFVLGSIVAGSEGGLPLPKVRHDLHIATKV